MGDTWGEASGDALANAVALAGERGSAQLVVARSGEVVVDEVFDDEPVDVFAVQKGLVSVMFGIAEAHGLLRLDDPVSDHLGAGWTKLPRAAEAKLTVRRVLDMTTGMDDELRPLGEVGISWRYNNVAYNYLKTVLEVVTGQSLSAVSRAWLFEPLGMRSSSWVERPVLRPDGKPITGLLSTAGDIANFGTMMLAGGNGVVPPEHLGRLGRPGSDENPAWGLCWWNNDQTYHRLPRREADVQHGPVTPGAPADMIAARGAMENYLFLVPSLDMVVARTAKAARRSEHAAPFDRVLWGLLAGA